MILRIWHKKLGGHFHCGVFTAEQENFTFAKCGDLCFRENEFREVQVLLGDNVQWLSEDGKR